MHDIYASDLPAAPVIVWFRNDLRVADNLALSCAAESGNPVIPLFIRENGRDALPLGAAQGWWLHRSLQSLSSGLRQYGARLVLRTGDAQTVLDELISSTGARALLWNRRHAPHMIERDAAIKAGLRDRNIAARTFDGQLLHEPTRLKTGSGGPYRVYTPFWRAFSGEPPPRPPAGAPQTVAPFDGDLACERLADWDLLPVNPDWSGGIAAEWKPGETGAQERLARFVREALDGYAGKRDRPGRVFTSKLSPHLAFGEISPFQVWKATEDARHRIPESDMAAFRKELAWREFSYHLLVNFPSLADRNFNADFDAFPWREADDHLACWQQGRTGYPIVDAGMRELWQTGWVHNRVRMIVASFLVKHLLIDWRHGEAWFRDTLVDADPASNAAGWQWVAGSGADAAPYFRIFNPVLQGEKFDADGAYVRRFVPEIAGLPDNWLHRPWDAPRPALERAGVMLGETYPRPVVDHKGARDRALAAYRRMKENAA
ncbi:MAG: deoxyribodipyrimidine photo-lyase [Oricola sp.]